MTRPRLVATDLDGTLLHTDGSVTERTRSVIADVEALGTTVVFVTGRPVRWMGHLWQHVGHHGIAVCSNGGIVYDVPGQRIAQARTISREVGLQVASMVREELPETGFSVEKLSGFAKEPTFGGRAETSEHLVGPLPEIYDDTVVKLLALHPTADPEDYWARVESLVGDLVETTWSAVGALVEMTAAGVTKATTLELLCGELGVSAKEVVAFGDMPNDVAMLEWAGTSYAMGNAHPLAKAAADHVAPRNDQDGVATVLERLFLTPPRSAGAPTGDETGVRGRTRPARLSSTERTLRS